MIYSEYSFVSWFYHFQKLILVVFYKKVYSIKLSLSIHNPRTYYENTQPMRTFLSVYIIKGIRFKIIEIITFIK